MKPGYPELHQSGDLGDRIKAGFSLLEECRLCPRACSVNRLEDERGLCGVGRNSVVASYNPHFGEESPLVGERGSGTIFFAGCNLGCIFCQNHDIAHDATAGLVAAPDELAGVMLQIQKEGCHNINFVTPSHVVPQILEALPIAIDHGLSIPLVYNTSSYDSLETLALLDGVVDIYMPDVKMWEPLHAKRFLRAMDYPEVAKAAVREMHRQVGGLVVDEAGVAMRGLVVRHLVMPEDVAGSGQWFRFLADISKATYLNIMDQYRPCAVGGDMPPLNRMITDSEYDFALREAEKNGLHRLDDRGDRFYRLLNRL